MEFPRVGKKLFYPSGMVDTIDHELTSDIDREFGHRSFYTQNGYLVYIDDNNKQFGWCASEEWELVHSMEYAGALASHDHRVYTDPEDIASLNAEYGIQAKGWVYSHDSHLLYAIDRQVTWDNLEGNWGKILAQFEPRLYDNWLGAGVI